MRSRSAIRAHILVCCLLLSGAGPNAVARRVFARQSTQARDLVEVTGMRRHVLAFFEESVSRYQKNWPGAVIAGMKAKGLFKPLKPEDAQRMERLIYDFSDGVFEEVKLRVGREVATAGNLETLVAQTYGKHFNEKELTELAAFSRTPAGRKLVEGYSAALKDASLAAMEESGIFNVSPSPEEDEARADKLLRDLKENPTNHLRKVLSAMKPLPENFFTPTEAEGLKAFAQTPLGRKAAEVFPELAAEILASNTRLFGPTVAKITQEVYGEKLEEFQRRAYEILKDYGPKKGNGTAGSR